MARKRLLNRRRHTLADQVEQDGGRPRRHLFDGEVDGCQRRLLIGGELGVVATNDGDLLRVVPGKNGIFLPIMVSSGRIIGTWRRRASMGALSVEPVPFSGLTARQLAGFASAIRGYSRFLGLPATVLPPAELGPTAGNDSLEA